MGLAKMKVSAYADGDFTQKLDEMPVMINPEKYSHTFKILYTDPQAQGGNGGSPKFNKIPSDVVKMELVFDGTGVVPPGTGETQSPTDGITKQIERFKNLVFSYDGKIHSPKFLTLAWGTLLFRCRLSTLDLTFSLFKPDGTPLRARASTVFLGYNDEEQLAKQANKSSPDLSHLILVKAGDTLPLLCAGVYGTSSVYIQVARANGLTGFRDLQPGTQLLFPPLGDAG
jgi:Contractile injection system tube protein